MPKLPYPRSPRNPIATLIEGVGKGIRGAADNVTKGSTVSDTERSRHPRGRVILAYKTGWPDTFIHYKTTYGGWTRLPGAPLVERDDDRFPGFHMISLDDCPIEFVLNDGRNNWVRSSEVGS